MATRVTHSKQSTKHVESPLAAEEWQLRILWELHKKQPRPTVEQRKQLAVQTGLDAKWIAKWFKRVNGSSKSKSKHQNTVGCPLSPTATAATNGSNPVESAISTATESGSSPSLFSPALEHPSLFSRSDVVPEGGRSTAAGPYHGSPQSQSWELELTAMTTALQASRKRHHILHPHSQGANPAAAAVPQTHPDLVEHSQQTPLGIVTNPVYLASSFSGTQTGMEDITAQSVKSRVGPHTSPPSPDPLQARYFHLNLFSSEALAQAYTTTEFGHPFQCGLGPAAESAATAALGPTSAPLPSMYWLLFDAKEHDERDSVVDGLGAEDASRRASSRPLLGMMPPHVTVPVTPTPVSFLAKWEDMLALERRIHSASDGVKLVKSKQAQAARAVEAHRTKQGSRRGEVTLTGTGTDRARQDRDHGQHFSPMTALSDIFKSELHEEVTPVSYSLRSHSGAE